jgi:hypothetical protein
MTHVTPMYFSRRIFKRHRNHPAHGTDGGQWVTVTGSRPKASAPVRHEVAVWTVEVAGGPRRTYPPHRPFPTADSAIRFGAAAVERSHRPTEPASCRAGAARVRGRTEPRVARQVGIAGRKQNPPRETRVAPPASSSSSSSPPRASDSVTPSPGPRRAGGAREWRKP